MGQSVPANESIDPSGYLPGRTAVTNAFRDISNNLRTKFVAEKKDGLLQFSGTAAVDKVYQKLQRKHYYDCTLHFLQVKENGPFSENWMRCMAHSLNNSMKTLMSKCKKVGTLSVVAEDFRAMKKIIEDTNCAGWNHLPPNGCKLKQEC